MTNLMLTVTARPSEGGRAVIDAPVAIGRTFPVGTGGHWRGRIEGAGLTVTIEAHLNGSGIRGDLCVDIDSAGPLLLTTGPLTWHAKRSD